MVSKGNEKEEQTGMIIKWFIYSIIYAFIMGILYGTANYYFNTIPLVFGLYMDIAWFFILIGLSGWTLMSYFILKKYKVKMI